MINDEKIIFDNISNIFNKNNYLLINIFIEYKLLKSENILNLNKINYLESKLKIFKFKNKKLENNVNLLYIENKNYLNYINLIFIKDIINEIFNNVFNLKYYTHQETNFNSNKINNNSKLFEKYINNSKKNDDILNSKFNFISTKNSFITLDKVDIFNKKLTSPNLNLDDYETNKKSPSISSLKSIKTHNIKLYNSNHLQTFFKQLNSPKIKNKLNINNLYYKEINQKNKINNKQNIYYNKIENNSKSIFNDMNINIFNLLIVNSNNNESISNNSKSYDQVFFYENELFQKNIFNYLNKSILVNNIFIISYGLLISKKTFTLMGSKSNPGIIPNILNTIQNLNNINLKIYEISNNKLIDLTKINNKNYNLSKINLINLNNIICNNTNDVNMNIKKIFSNRLNKNKFFETLIIEISTNNKKYTFIDTSNENNNDIVEYILCLNTKSIYINTKNIINYLLEMTILNKNSDFYLINNLI